MIKIDAFRELKQKCIPNVEMTRPRVVSDLLMLPPSFNRTPVAPDAEARSLDKMNRKL